MLIYILIGLTYYLINIFVRKLHKDNEDEDGWLLTILWIFGWPICFIALLIHKLKNRY